MWAFISHPFSPPSPLHPFMSLPSPFFTPPLDTPPPAHCTPHSAPHCTLLYACARVLCRSFCLALSISLYIPLSIPLTIL